MVMLVLQTCGRDAWDSFNFYSQKFFSVYCSGQFNANCEALLSLRGMRKWFQGVSWYDKSYTTAQLAGIIEGFNFGSFKNSN